MEHLDDDAELSVQWMARLKGSQCPKSWRNPPNRQSKEENEVLNISKPSIFTWFHGVPHFYPGVPCASHRFSDPLGMARQPLP